MKQRIALLFVNCLIQLFAVAVHAQPIYNMSNLTVDDCEGILLDSENGDIGGTYDDNENYTFSIGIPGNGHIVMDFLSFDTKEGFGFLSIYDGPNISSNQIGEDYHGEVDPPLIVATSGCLTLHFTSAPDSYLLTVINQNNGCSLEATVELPDFDPIKANFIIRPNQICISSLDPEIEIIDFSVGARGGYWDFGDESPTVPYVFGEPVNHVLPTPAPTPSGCTWQTMVFVSPNM